MSAQNGPAYNMVKVTAGTAFKTCRGLLVGAGGAATLTDGNGIEQTLVPLQTGYNPIFCQNISATGLVASDIWALY